MQTTNCHSAIPTCYIFLLFSITSKSEMPSPFGTDTSAFLPSWRFPYLKNHTSTIWPSQPQGKYCELFTDNTFRLYWLGTELQSKLIKSLSPINKCTFILEENVEVKYLIHCYMTNLYAAKNFCSFGETLTYS